MACTCPTCGNSHEDADKVRNQEQHDAESPTGIQRPKEARPV